MDPSVRAKAEGFIRPLYQDLDGISRYHDVERVERIARILFKAESEAEEHQFTLLLLFHGLERWLKKVGSVSRASLIIGEGVSEGDLRRVSESLSRLDSPVTPAEKALAAAILIDASGAHGLAVRFAHARREGSSAVEIAREEMGPSERPSWLDPRATQWLDRRDATRREVCARVLGELQLEDAPDDTRTGGALRG